MEHIYDMLIVGGGPGGYTAALYAARAGLDVLVLEKLSAGGQMALTAQIENYPGVAGVADGYELGENMRRSAEQFGAKTLLAEVTRLELEGDVKTAYSSEGTFYGRTLVFATGANPRKLGLDREYPLTGRGVHYCASCDGMFYRGKTVVVAGGGNTAAAEALHLSRVAKKVILVHRRDTLRATKIYHQSLMEAENVEFYWDSAVTGLLGEDRLTGLEITDLKTGERRMLDCDGLFVSIGRVPATELVRGQLELDEQGYVLADETTRTNLAGVYAVGDVRTKALRQIVTATADGATAAHFAAEWLAVG